MMRIALALLVASPLVASCKRGTEPKPEVSDETRPGPERGSAGGFSASLSADLEVRGPTKGSGSDFFDDTPSEAGSAGSAAPGPANAAVGSAGSNAANAGSSTGSASAGSANAGSKTGSANVANTGSAGSAGPVATNAGSAGTTANTGSNAGTTAPGSTPEIEIHTPKPPIAMTAELKAIQLSLLPNWKRDTVEPATISLEVDVQSRNVKETFKFRYGYEDPKAPTDREAFKKYLADAKIMKVTTDRQRGAAWYLEGNDASGHMSFRLIVTYGGKRLYCGGSAYKTNDLGDIRDEVVVQAKKICETVSL